MTTQNDSFLSKVAAFFFRPFTAFFTFIVQHQNPKLFFWWCAGAHRETLEKVPTEHHKYVGIGFTVFITGVLATLAGGFAMYSLSSYKLLVAVFALIWGVMIFNLDRFIVSSLSRKNRWSVVPRILLAAVIAITISKPLEIQIFRNQVDFELKRYAEENRSAMVKKLQESLRLNELNEELRQIQARKDSISERMENAPKDIETLKSAKSLYESCDEGTKESIKRVDEERAAIQRDLNQLSVNATYLTSQWNETSRQYDRVLTKEGKGIQAKLYDRQRQLDKEKTKFLEECRDFKERMQDIESKIRIEKGQDILKGVELEDERLAEIQTARAKFKEQLELYDAQIANSSYGLAAEIRALHQLGSEDTGMLTLSLFLMFLFFTIETAPIFAKLLMGESVYEKLVEFSEDKILYEVEEGRIRRGFEIQEQEIRLRTELAFTQSKNDEFLADIDSKYRQVLLEKEQALALLKAEQEQRLQELKQNNQHLYDLQQTAYQQKLDLAKAEYEAKLNELQKEHELKMALAEDENNTERGRLQNEYEHTIEIKKQERKNTLNEMNTRHEHLVQLLKDQQESLRRQEKISFETKEKIEAIRNRLFMLKTTIKDQIETKRLEMELDCETLEYELQQIENEIYKLKEKEVSKSTIDKLAKAQEEIASEIVKKWKARELKRIEDEGIDKNIVS